MMLCLRQVVLVASVTGCVNAQARDLSGVRSVKVTPSARALLEQVDGNDALEHSRTAVRRDRKYSQQSVVPLNTGSVLGLQRSYDVKKVLTETAVNTDDGDAEVLAAASSAAQRSNETMELLAYWQRPGSELMNDEPFKMFASFHLQQSHKLVEISTPTNSLAFYVATGIVITLAFALMFFYSLFHDTIAEYTGLKLGHVCCIIYAGLSISIDLSIKNAAEAYGGSFPFNPACGVVVVEFAKLILSLILFAMHVGEMRLRGDSVQLPTAKDVAWLAVPAAIYAMNNLIVFQAIKSTPLSTFGVIRETMLIWNAFIWTATFRQSISMTRWLAILGIFFGCSVNQIPKMLSDEFTFGVMWACLLAFTNAAGAVANEYAMKQKAQLDINLQNSILYFLCGTFVLTGMAFFNKASVQSTEAFFTGFVPECWIVIVLQVFTGLAVSRILKYIEAVTKTIVAAIRGPGVIFLGAIIFHKQLHGSEVFATLCVCTACWVYLREGPLTQPKPLTTTEAFK